MKKKVSISDMAVEDVIVTMAESLGVEYKQDHHEFSLQLPEEFGEGHVFAYRFSDGLGVVRTSYTLKKDFHFQLQKGVVHPLKVSLNLGDPHYHKLEKDPDFTKIGHLQSSILSSVPSNNHMYMIPANTQSRIFTIEINRKKFDRRLADYESSIPEPLSPLFRDVKGVLPFSYIGSYSHRIAESVEKFIHNGHSGFIRKTYQEAKVLEIMSGFFEQFIDDQQSNGQRNVLRADQMKRIKRAMDHLRNNLDVPISIAKLSDIVGLNQNILQKGFKVVNGMTINEYESKVRMDEAHRLLMDTDLSISEITYKIGINSKSYFSKLFRERYGETPSGYREKYRSDKNTG